MRKFSALLLVLATALPAPVSAQTRVGTVQPGLSVSVAPVPTLTSPAMTLSPATLSAASLTPALIAPAPIQAVPGILQTPAAKIVPAALSAIVPAAAKSEKQDSEQAQAAGNALFDGAAKLAAPAMGDGPSVPAAAPEDRRSSGLSPPTDNELAAAYREARPQSRAVEAFRGDFVRMASEIVQKYTFMGDYFLQTIRADRSVIRAAEDLIAAHDARDHAPSRRFMQLLGRWHAFKDHAQEGMLAMKVEMMRRLGQPLPRNMPPSPIPNGEYWDMAAGMNAQGFIHRELEPGTNYSFFDYSPFVVSYLKTAAELAGARNAAVVEGDINKLERPAKPLAVLRTKNAVHYVPGFDKKLEEMADWIAPGGQLVIQNDPNPGQRSLIIEKHGPLIRRLIAAGWEFEYGFSGSPGNFGVYALDTMTLTRPKLAWEKSPEDAAREWSSYERAAKYLEARFNPMGFLFGR